MTPKYLFTNEQQALRNTVRSWCQRTWTKQAVRQQMGQVVHGHDRDSWRRLGRELGLIGSTVPSELGGVAAGHVELALIAEEFGRVLACAPLLGSTMATVALQHGASAEEARQLLKPVLAGERLATLVASDANGRWAPREPGIEATEGPGGWTVVGTAHHVLDGTDADDLLVLASSSVGELLVHVDGSDPGVRRTPISTLDQTRQQSTVRFEGATARLLSAPGGGRLAVEAATRAGALVLAAEQLGGSQVMLDGAVGYAQTHLQFGRPIGSFQAIRHRCADMAVHVEHARSAVLHAAWVADEAPESSEAALASSLAHVVASDAHVAVAGGALQVHGGVGFTWEHAIHLYLKRAWSDSALLGGRDDHRRRLRPLLEPAA